MPEFQSWRKPEAVNDAMFLPHGTGFTHRQSAAGSWDSICMHCFLTVVSKAMVQEEATLSATDAVHVCGVSQQQTDTAQDVT